MRKFFVAAALAIAAIAGTGTSADAAFRLRASADGGATYFIDAVDADLDGVIITSGVTGGTTINVNVGSSKPFTGSAAAPELSLGFVLLQGPFASAKTITIEVTDTGFTPLNTGGGFTASIGGTLSPGNSTVTYDAFASATNAEYSQTGTTVQVGPFSGPSIAFSGQGFLANPASDPYSLTSFVTVDLVASGLTGYDVSGNAKITAVPAPAGVALLMTGLPLLGVGAWFRRRTATKA